MSSSARVLKAMGAMWPRACEVAVAAWLALFATLCPQAISAQLVLHNLAVSLAIVACSVTSMVASGGAARFAHVVNLALGGWLVGLSALVSQQHSMALAQNDILVGLTLAMFAILPTRALDAPAAWRRYYRRNPVRQSPSDGC